MRTKAASLVWKCGTETFQVGTSPVFLLPLLMTHTHTQLAAGNTRALGTQYQESKGKTEKAGTPTLMECVPGLKAGDARTFSGAHPSTCQTANTGTN